MGCDIHAWLAREVDGVWVPCGILDESSTEETHTYQGKSYHWGSEWMLSCLGSRNYMLFGFIAGVRYTVSDPVADGRYWPDAGDYFQLVLNNPDLHSFTWLTIGELKEAFDRTDQEYITERDICDGVLPKIEMALNEPWSAIMARGYDNYGNDYRPIEKWIAMECGEAMLLSIPPPNIRIFVAFDN